MTRSGRPDCAIAGAGNWVAAAPAARPAKRGATCEFRTLHENLPLRGKMPGLNEEETISSESAAFVIRKRQLRESFSADWRLRWHRVEQRFGIVIGRPFDQIRCRRPFDDLAAAHYQNVVRHETHDRDVVADENQAEIPRSLNVF